MNKAHQFHKIVYRFLFLVVFCIVEATSVFGQAPKDSLYVFVGEIISVSKFTPIPGKNAFLMDNAYKVKCKILQNIYGNYRNDTIDFDAYDHYGEPAFSKYKNVMFFVSNYNGTLVQQKYLFFNVYQTTDGTWASPGNPYKFGNYKGTRDAAKLKFKSRISFDITNTPRENIKTFYPKRYYRIRKTTAVARTGTSVDELFIIEKNSVLKARGVFE